MPLKSFPDPLGNSYKPSDVFVGNYFISVAGSGGGGGTGGLGRKRGIVREECREGRKDGKGGRVGKVGRVWW